MICYCYTYVSYLCEDKYFDKFLVIWGHIKVYTGPLCLLSVLVFLTYNGVFFFFKLNPVQTITIISIQKHLKFLSINIFH